MTVTIGTNTFTTVLDASGNWSVGVPASVVSALANGTVTINASVTDAAGKQRQRQPSGDGQYRPADHYL